ncbi:hypothetical protein KEM55_000789 [Ascosphaera atra]|nr:hypothetical protein KEM55_000789 [Ascosphaera atra]
MPAAEIVHERPSGHGKGQETELSETARAIGYEITGEFAIGLFQPIATHLDIADVVTTTAKVLKTTGRVDTPVPARPLGAGATQEAHLLPVAGDRGRAIQEVHHLHEDGEQGHQVGAFRLKETGTYLVLGQEAEAGREVLLGEGCRRTETEGTDLGMSLVETEKENGNGAETSGTGPATDRRLLIDTFLAALE